MAECITTLADSALNGRETGSVGASGALVYICDRMRAANLRPMGSGIPNRRDNTYAQPFSCPTGQRGRNAIGLLPASDPTCQQYIIVSAHYDHLGRIKGILYPGADSNASGVGVMLSLADAFAALRQAGVTLKRNLLFVAYDGKEFSMAGARFFAATLGIAPENIVLNLNIDQIGCTFEPPTPGNPNYILVLGDKNTTPEKGSAARFRTLLDNNNLFYATKLDIDYTFYNSPTFGDIFFQMTEQCFLAQQGVPSLLITSGVHDATYKPQDTPDIINYPVLAKRTRWLFFSLWDLLQR